MKKLITVTLVAGTFLTTSLGAVVNAASWHSGFPSAVLGTWEAKPTTKGTSKAGTGRTTIGADSITSEHRFAPVNPISASGFKYKYNKGNKYTVTNGAYKLSFHVYNHNKIYFSGTRTGSYGDAATYYRK